MENSQVKKYVIEDILTEIHMIGEYVAVRWNLKKRNVSKQLTGEDGLTYTWSGVVFDREEPPHISFPDVREGGGKAWLDDDDTVSGGLYVKDAETLVEELKWAIGYIKDRGWE